MADSFTTKSYNPARLSGVERVRLMNDVWSGVDKTFSGTTRQNFARSVLFPAGAASSQIYLHVDKSGLPIGFLAIHQWRVKLEKPATVLTLHTGVHEKWRRHNINAKWLLCSVLKVKLARLFRPLYVFSRLIHPTSYLTLYRYSRPYLWPEPAKTITHPLAGITISIARQLGYTPYRKTSHALVMSAELAVRSDSDQRADTWHNKTAPAEFFLQQNPEYSEGQGLLSVVDASVAAISYALIQLLRKTTAAVRKAKNISQ